MGKKDLLIIAVLVILISTGLILKFNIAPNDWADLTLGLLVGLTIGKTMSIFKKRKP